MVRGNLRGFASLLNKIVSIIGLVWLIICLNFQFMHVHIVTSNFGMKYSNSFYIFDRGKKWLLYYAINVLDEVNVLLML